jgi:hypothetical protein
VLFSPLYKDRIFFANKIEKAGERHVFPIPYPNPLLFVHKQTRITIFALAALQREEQVADLSSGSERCNTVLVMRLVMLELQASEALCRHRRAVICPVLLQNLHVKRWQHRKKMPRDLVGKCHV